MKCSPHPPLILIGRDLRQEGKRLPIREKPVSQLLPVTGKGELLLLRWERMEVRVIYNSAHMSHET